MSAIVMPLDYGHYYNLLSSKDLAELITFHDRFEEQIYLDVWSLLQTTLARQNEVRGSKVIIDGVWYDFHMPPPALRRLEVILNPGVPKGEHFQSLSLEWYESKYGKRIGRRRFEAYQVAPIVARVEDFGDIQQITVEWPIALQRKFEDLPYRIAHIYKTAYRALKQAFISSCRKNERLLFDGVYGILFGLLEEAHMDGLRDEVWFTVTRVSESQFRYELLAEQVEKIANDFIANQHRLLSPFKLLSALVCDEAVDTIWASRAELDLRIGKSVSMPFSKLQNVGTPHWNAEMTLFHGFDLSAIEICVSGGYALLLNCSQNSIGTVQSISKYALRAFEDQFSKNVSKYRFSRQRAARALIDLYSSEKVAEWVDIARNVALNVLGNLTTKIIEIIVGR